MLINAVSKTKSTGDTKENAKSFNCPRAKGYGIRGGS